MSGENQSLSKLWATVCKANYADSDWFTRQCFIFLILHTLVQRWSPPRMKKSYIYHLQHLFPHPTPSHNTCTLARTHAHNCNHIKPRIEQSSTGYIHCRLKPMALYRQFKDRHLASMYCMYVAAPHVFEGLLWRLTGCLVGSHTFVYQKTDAFLHKTLYNDALSYPMKVLLFHSASRKVSAG